MRTMEAMGAIISGPLTFRRHTVSAQLELEGPSPLFSNSGPVPYHLYLLPPDEINYAYTLITQHQKSLRENKGQNNKE